MFDINFFKNTYQFKQDLLLGKLNDNSKRCTDEQRVQFRTTKNYILIQVN